MPDQPTTDVHNGSDFTWHNAKAFWIIMIIAAAILLLHTMYKLTINIRRNNEPQALELEDREHIGEEINHGIRRPRRAMVRRNTRSSDVSALPRYEEFNEDVKCGEDMQVEKRGRYSYAVSGSWPRPRDAVDGGVNVKQNRDEDALATDHDTLAPPYRRE
jgi:hypothetical protein